MFISPQVENPCGVAVRAGLVYWPNAGSDPNPTIARSGAPPPPQPDGDFVPNAGNFPCWPAVSDSHIYWGSGVGGILRADLDGMNANVVVNASSFGGVAILGPNLFFANNAEGTISRANLDGSSPQFAFVTGAGSPTGLAVDSGFAAPPGGGGIGDACDDLTLAEAKRNKKKGTANLAAEVACAGALEVGGKGVKSAEKRADGAGKVELPVKAQGKKKKKLNQTGKAKIEAEVIFTPDGGAAISQDMSVKLVKK